MSTRSIVASFLLGRKPPRARARLLVAWCGLFDVNEGAARVALSRMVDTGDLVAADGHYELAGRLRSRQQVQDVALAPPTEWSATGWSGAWRLALVRPGGRSASARAALRNAALTVRMVELREGVWGRPDNLPRQQTQAAEVISEQCEMWTGTPDGPVGLAAFRLDEWAARGGELLDHLTRTTAAICSHPGDGPALVTAFEVGAAALQHLRHDPLLPETLLPERWPAPRLRSAYRDYERAMAESIRAWYS